MEKTYMKYMAQGSGTDYKMKNAPNKTKEPKPFHGDGGGIDDGPVTEGEDYDQYMKMMLKKKGVKNLGDLSDEDTKAFFAEVDKGYKAKNESLDVEIDLDIINTVENLLGEYNKVSIKTLSKFLPKAYESKGFNSGYLRTELPMSYDSSNYDKLFEAYNNVKAYPQQATKGGSKTEYPLTDKPSVAKKKKDKADWQGADAGEKDKVDFNHLGLSITDGLELFASIFNLDEERVVTKDTIAKKKKELAAASTALRKQHAGSVGFNKRAEKSGFGGEAGKRQEDKVKRAKERKARGLKGRTGVYTAGQGKIKSPKIIGGQRVAKDSEKKGLSGQKAKDAPEKKKDYKATTKKATAYYKGRKEANKATELKNMGKEGVKKKASYKRKLTKKQDYEANKKFFGWKDDNK